MIPVRNLYYLLCYAWDSLEEAGTVDVEDLEDFDRIEDLFGVVLARGVMRLARRGLDRSYVDVEEEIAGVRGKIELGATIKRSTLVRHRLVCSFEELSADVLHNRILFSSLNVLARHPGVDDAVREEVRLAASRMPGVSEIPLSRGAFSQVQLDRNRRAYRFLINVCRLLHETRLVDPSSGRSRFVAIDLEQLTAWKVFEDFAARFFDREQREFDVGAQKYVRWHDLRGRSLASEGRIPIMKPDLLLEGADRRIILDTKYYKDGGLGDEPGAKLHAGNLYQVFAYVMNREQSHPDGPRHEGMLLYPTVGDETRVDFTTHGHRFQARSVDLSRPWREIHEAMLEVLA